MKRIICAAFCFLILTAVGGMAQEKSVYTYNFPKPPAGFEQGGTWSPPPEYKGEFKAWEPPPGFEKTQQPWSPPSGWQEQQDKWSPPTEWK